MIPKAEVLRTAEETGLLATTIEKDYALGWVLFAVAQHRELSRWIFKGGTCLKKCYFDTYRFSEDLDFTLPGDVPYETPAILGGLQAIARWVFQSTGIEVAEDGIEVEEIQNKVGLTTFQARLTFRGPLGLARQNRQRVKLDLTRHELLVTAAERREVFHGYSDLPDPAPTIRCYSLKELLVEKVRALLERSGRARDVYDVVNIGRNFSSDFNVTEARVIATRKFAFKGLPAPTSDLILGSIDPQVLAVDWNNALRHQLPVLPPPNEFLSALRDVLDWLFVPARPGVILAAVPAKAEEVLVPPVRFASPALGLARAVFPGGMPVPANVFGSRMDRIRFAARNRLLAQVNYHGVSRLVEPYSLRIPKTGNLLLYVYETQRGSRPGEGIKAFKVDELGDVAVSNNSFQPRYLIEL